MLPFPLAFLAGPALAPAWHERMEILVPIILVGITVLLFLGTNYRKMLSWLRTREDHVLDPVQLQNMLAGFPPLIVDLRRPDDFGGKLGHLRGAVNIPFADLPARCEELRSSVGNRGIVLMDAGSDTQAHQAYRFLLTRGFTWVYLLKGGMRAWRAEMYRTYQ